jgi:pimeloyl-ACP methyl ester carboxylesterase
MRFDVRHSWARLSAVGLLVWLCAGCTALRLAPFRDDQFIADYHYTLGEQYVEVNGLRLCYQEYGAGPPLVILPGLGTSIDFWQLSIPELATRHRVIAIDLPGFGKSDKPDAEYDLLWIDEQVCALLDQRGVWRATFIGGSMGGHLGLLMALTHPERVERLVIMGSSGVWPPPGPLLNLALNTLFNEPLVTLYLRQHWPAIYGLMFVHRTPLTDRIFRYQMALRANGGAFAAEGRASTRALRSIFYHSVRDRLSEIKVPVLLIWGAQDKIHPAESARLFRAGLPDSRLVIVPDAGHEVMVDQPETFNRLVLAFLDGGTAAVTDEFPAK